MSRENNHPRKDMNPKQSGANAEDAGSVCYHIARALARDYLELCCVNPDTGEFIEYVMENQSGMLTEARRGNDFFERCGQESGLFVDPEDRQGFMQAMSRERLTAALRENRAFQMIFRRMKDGIPRYVKMDAFRAADSDRLLMIALRDYDETMRQRLSEQRIQEERSVYACLHVLTGNFLVVYVVDPATDRYREFSATDDYTKNFTQAKEGTDFFGTVRREARLYTVPEDLDRFLSAFSKEKVMAAAGRGDSFTLDYCLLKEGRPFHVRMKAALIEKKEGLRLIVGLMDYEAQFHREESERKIQREKDIYNQITASLAEQYDTLYYINLDDNTYSEISSTDEYKKLNVPATGNDFFAESRRSIRKYVHPEDQEKAISIHYKDVMLSNLKNQNSYAMEYRLVVAGEVRYIRHTEIMARDRKHLIVCIQNIDGEIQARIARKADLKKSVTYTQIAERLADHYDLIYYIDCETAHYTELSTKKRSGELKVQSEGRDFFATSRKNADRLVFSEDRERIKLFLDRDHLISRLENRRQLTEDYRMIVSGGKTQFSRMSVTYSSDHSHFIICVENRDNDVRREQEQVAALSLANEMARRDELTHTKNKTAYHEMEKELQKCIDAGSGSFGIVVADINGLKAVNDTKGHKAGDEYIRACCLLVCRVFQHSPVFRIGGDEFVVVLRSEDYQHRSKLLSGLRKQVESNISIGEGPVVASGMAEYQPEQDKTTGDVFNRADSLMYADKARLKEMKLLQETHSLKEKAKIQIISEERRNKLDALFGSFEIVSEGTYVYLCDMKYDYSRWSKAAVDTYGLPSAYMYGAGDIWENRIHPEDRAAYHRGIDEIFSGIASGHDMQYRAMRLSGEYDVCTCRGVVIRDQSGEPDYFAGTIRNHGIQGHIDTLTGLRNQYGFFEDLQSLIKRNASASVILFGISKFSEINEMYGYPFGNRVLQCYARSAFEETGNTGHTYRMDGTKCAVISNSLSVDEMREKYNRFRARLREGIHVNDRAILLDLHGSVINVENFDIDSQTIYACLNFAYEESKARQQGDLVEFRSELNGESHQRLEKLYAIRASIMHDYDGFFLLYQPVVDVKTGQLIGAEALLRWKDDRYGTVPPDQFIPVLETDPLFPDLGDWIIRESILAAKQVLARYPEFVVNVNLSYSQLEKPDFADKVIQLLGELEYPAEHLCLEVTERCRLLDLRRLKNIVIHLRSHGVQVALDDFGTGFSSVGIVREIPFDTIKIDRSLVQKIEGNETDRKLIQSITDLASILGTQVCVEGIETAEMHKILKNYHVKSLQGYYFAKPMPLEELLEWNQPV